MRMMSTVRGLRDNNGKPLMFGISFDGTLAAVGAAFGDAEAVRVERPTPTSVFAHAVAGSQDKTGKIWLAASFGTDADTASNLYVCGPLSNNPADWLVKDNDSLSVARFKWTQKRTGGEKTHIPELQIGTDDDDQGPPMILIATTLKTGKVPRYERLSAAPNDDTAEEFPKFEDATEFLDVALGSELDGDRRGVYALYRLGARQRLEFVGVPEFGVPMQTTLTAPPGAMTLKPQTDKDGQTELIVRGNGVFRFPTGSRSHAQSVKIANDTVSPVRVTSRSVLTDDYGHDEKGEFGTRKAFRCTISVPVDTCQVYIWATEPTKAEVDGKAVTLDPSKGLRVAPSAVSRITVSLPANGVTCPTLMIRTNEMDYHQRLYIFPDVGLHRSIMELPAGSLFEARERLGMSGMSEKSAAGIQKVLQNLTGSIQYTHNRTDYGFHHDRTVYANNLEDTHFSLSTGAGEHAYQALDQQQASNAVGGAQPITVDDLKIALGDLESVTITTLEKLGGDFVETANRVGSDFWQMAHKMGDDVVQGDLLGLLKDFLQGGENIGMDLFRGAANVFIDASVGEARILVAVVKLAGKTLQFVLDHTGKVGKFLSWLLEQIGVAFDKFIQFLSKAIGWHDVVQNHYVIGDMINDCLDKLADGVVKVRERGDAAFKNAQEKMDEVFAGPILQLGGVPEGKQPLSNEFLEASEWLAHRFASHSESASEIPVPGSLIKHKDNFDRFIDILEGRLGRSGEKVIIALNAANIDFEKFGQNIDKPELLLAGMLEIVKVLATIGIDVVAAIWDTLMNMLEDLFRGVKEVLNNENWNIPFLSDFYSFITKGENPTQKPLTLLGIASLLIAIPATPIYRSILKEEKFALANFSMGLKPMPPDIVAAGATSAATQFALALTTVPVGISAITRAGQLDNEDAWSAKYPGAFVALGLVDFVLSLTSNIFSTVVGYQHSKEDTFWDYHDAVTAPALWGKHLLNYSFVPISIGLVASLGSLTRWSIWKKFGPPGTPTERSFDRFMSKGIDFIHCARSVSSVGQIVLASTQQFFEYEKKFLLDRQTKDFWDTDDLTILRAGFLNIIINDGLSEAARSQAQATVNTATLPTLQNNRVKLKNYYQWAGGSGIPDKGWAIFMGIFPHSSRWLMTDIAARSTDGIVPAITAVFIAFCRMSGGVTTSVRTENQALL
jgi:hypothetical protein